MRLFRTYGLYFAWLVAVVAMAGSLYFSEVRHFVPCAFCWYQRILMYPLVLILGIAAYKQDKGAVIYSLPLSLLGIGFALYQYLDQKIPSFGAAATCKVGVPCSTVYINWLGFISIPFLSLTAFTLVSALLILVATAKPDKANN